MRTNVLEPKLVEAVPPALEDGVLYISWRYRTAVHRCACGCGTKVVTPIRPASWKLIFDGDSVSLYPSIGNWQFPCRSHYYVRRNRIRWAGGWTDEQIVAGRRRDEQELQHYLGDFEPDAHEAGLDPNRERARRSLSRLLARARAVLRR
jgi:hypothetical protein